MANLASLQRVGEYSVYPKWKCKKCGELLWTERSARSHGRTWYITRDGNRHLKTVCKIIPLKKENDDEA